jgi:hypothetical protein
MSENLDLDLLDMSLDDIEDLPGFEVPYNGEYLLKMHLSLKLVNKKAAVESNYEVVECLKKNDESDPDTVPGTKFSSLYFLQGDEDKVKMSLGRLKELLAQPAEELGEGNVKILVRDHFATPRMVSATVTRRADKEDKEKFYAGVKNLKLEN